MLATENIEVATAIAQISVSEHPRVRSMLERGHTAIAAGWTWNSPLFFNMLLNVLRILHSAKPCAGTTIQDMYVCMQICMHDTTHNANWSWIGGLRWGGLLLTCSRTHSLAHSFTHTHTLTFCPGDPPLTHLLTYPSTHLLTSSLTDSHTHSLTPSPTHLPTYPLLTYSLTQPLTHWLTHSFIHPLIHSLNYSLTRSLTYSLIHLLTNSPTHLRTHSLTYSLTHLLTHLLTCSKNWQTFKSVSVVCLRKAIKCLKM